jgi:putative membrane protein
LKTFILTSLFLLTFFISALFFSQNDKLIKINYIIDDFELPLNILMIVLFLMGAMLSTLSFFVKMMMLKFQLKKNKYLFSLREKKIDNLRSLPIKDDY